MAAKGGSTKKPEVPKRTDFSGLGRDIRKWTNPNLKDLCRFHILTVGGNKTNLLDRLRGYDIPGVDQDDEDEPAPKAAPKKTMRKKTKDDAPKRVKKPIKGFKAGDDKPSDTPVGDPEDKRIRKPKEFKKSDLEGATPFGDGWIQKPKEAKKSEPAGPRLKVTAAEKERANKYREKLEEVLRQIRESNGGNAVYDSNFGDVQRELDGALDELATVQGGEVREATPEPEPEVHEPEVEDDGEEEEVPPEKGSEGSGGGDDYNPESPSSKRSRESSEDEDGEEEGVVVEPPSKLRKSSSEESEE